MEIVKVFILICAGVGFMYFARKLRFKLHLKHLQLGSMWMARGASDDIIYEVVNIYTDRGGDAWIKLQKLHNYVEEGVEYVSLNTFLQSFKCIKIN